MFFGRAGKKPDWQMIDIHCHILPGLDDGAQDISETVAMLKIAASEGVSDMVVTPHFRPGRFTASPEKVMETLWKVQKAAEREQISIRLYPGNEVYYFDDMAEYLKQQKLCTLNGSACVLIEFSPSAMLRTIQNAADKLLNEGYRPILAHVERYESLQANAEDAVFLHEMGMQLQVNASTVMGKAGTASKRFVYRLLDENAVDYIGSDAHGSRHRTPEIARCRDAIIKRYGYEYAQRLMRSNALEMIGL